MYSRNTSGIAVRLSQTATVEVAGADKVDCHDSHGYRIAFESNADCRLNPCILVESSVTPSKLNPEVPDFHPHGWAAGPCVTRKFRGSVPPPTALLPDCRHPCKSKSKSSEKREVSGRAQESAHSI